MQRVLGGGLVLFLLLAVEIVLCGQQPLPSYMYGLVSTAPPVEFTYGTLIDINGDGLPDWVLSYAISSQVAQNLIFINNGIGGWVVGSEWESPETVALRLFQGARDKKQMTEEQYMKLVELLASGDATIKFYAKHMQNETEFIKHALHRERAMHFGLIGK